MSRHWVGQIGLASQHRARMSGRVLSETGGLRPHPPAVPGGACKGGSDGVRTPRRSRMQTAPAASGDGPVSPTITVRWGLSRGLNRGVALISVIYQYVMVRIWRRGWDTPLGGNKSLNSMIIQ